MWMFGKASMYTMFASNPLYLNVSYGMKTCESLNSKCMRTRAYHPEPDLASSEPSWCPTCGITLLLRLVTCAITRQIQCSSLSVHVHTKTIYIFYRNKSRTRRYTSCLTRSTSANFENYNIFENICSVKKSEGKRLFERERCTAKP